MTGRSADISGSPDKPAVPGDSIPVDDEFVLWLIERQ
jgi:hypothetical protein